MRSVDSMTTVKKMKSNSIDLEVLMDYIIDHPELTMEQLCQKLKITGIELRQCFYLKEKQMKFFSSKQEQEKYKHAQKILKGSNWLTKNEKNAILLKLDRGYRVSYILSHYQINKTQLQEYIEPIIPIDPKKIHLNSILIWKRSSLRPIIQEIKSGSTDSRFDDIVTADFLEQEYRKYYRIVIENRIKAGEAANPHYRCYEQSELNQLMIAFSRQEGSYRTRVEKVAHMYEIDPNELNYNFAICMGDIPKPGRRKETIIPINKKLNHSSLIKNPEWFFFMLESHFSLMDISTVSRIPYEKLLTWVKETYPDYASDWKPVQLEKNN